MNWFFRNSKQKKINNGVISAMETMATIFDRIDKDLDSHKKMILALSASLKSHREMIDALRGYKPEEEKKIEEVQ